MSVYCFYQVALKMKYKRVPIEVSLYEVPASRHRMKTRDIIKKYAQKTENDCKEQRRTFKVLEFVFKGPTFDCYI